MFRQTFRIFVLLRWYAVPWLLAECAMKAANIVILIYFAFFIRDCVLAAASGQAGIAWQGAITALELTGVLVAAFAVCPLVTAYCEMQFEQRLRLKLFDKLNRISMGELQKFHSGDLLARFNGDIRCVIDFVKGALMQFVYTLAWGLGCLAGLWLLDKWIVLPVLVCGMVVFAINRRFLEPLRLIAEKGRELNAALLSWLSELLRCMTVVRVFGLAAQQCGNGAALGGNVRGNYLQNARLASTQNLFNTSAAALVTNGIMLGYIAYSVFFRQDSSGVATLIGAAFVIEGALALFVTTGGLLGNLQQALAGATRVFALLEIGEETDKCEEKLIDYRAGMAFKLRDVQFGYSTAQPVCSNLSLVIEAGKMTALCGESGCGKSTLLKLLLRFYEPDGGEIYCFGKRLGGYDLTALRKSICYLPQENAVFSGTIADNIRIGNPAAAFTEIEQAARLAQAHDFIMSFPDNYQTLIGEQGTALSEGQKQRVAIARAFAKNALVVLLDEPTAALDAESEQSVMLALKELLRGRTAVVVTHRQSTARIADRIINMEKGGTVL